MKYKVTKLDPADFPEVPLVEDVFMTPTGPGAGLPGLSLSTGEDIEPVWEDLTVYTSPEGLPVFLEVGGTEDPEEGEEAGLSGDVYRLDPEYARLFVWGLGGPLEAGAAQKTRAAHFFLSRAMEDPEGEKAAHYLQKAALSALDAAVSWPGEEKLSKADKLRLLNLAKFAPPEDREA